MEKIEVSESNYVRSVIDRYNLHEVLKSWGVDITNKKWKDGLDDEDNHKSLGEFDLSHNSATITIDDLPDSEDKPHLARSTPLLRNALIKVRTFTFITYGNGLSELWVRRGSLFVLVAELQK